jgi:hypothetical protein
LYFIFGLSPDLAKYSYRWLLFFLHFPMDGWLPLWLQIKNPKNANTKFITTFVVYFWMKVGCPWCVSDIQKRQIMTVVDQMVIMVGT